MLWAYYFTPYRIDFTYYNGYIYGAYINNTQITWFKADTNLNLLNKRSYEMTDTSIGLYYIQDVFTDSVGNLYIVSALWGARYGPVIIKFDTNGNLVWAKSYWYYPYDTCGAMPPWAYGFSVRKLRNGILLGNYMCQFPVVVSDSVAFYGAALLKVDFDGNMLWSKLWMPYNKLLEVVSFIPSDSVGSSIYVIMYAGSSDFAVAKIDSAANVLWMKKYYANNILLPLNSGVLIGDKIIFGGRAFDWYPDSTKLDLFKIDTFGNIISTKILYPTSASHGYNNRFFVEDGHILMQYGFVAIDTSLNLVRNKAYRNVQLRVKLPSGYYISKRYGFFGTDDTTFVFKMTPYLYGCPDMIVDTLRPMNSSLPSVIDYDSVAFYDWTSYTPVIDLPMVEISPDPLWFEPICSISSEERYIEEDDRGEYEVYDVAGRLIYRGYSDGTKLKRGVYFLRKGKKVYKKIVR